MSKRYILILCVLFLLFAASPSMGAGESQSAPDDRAVKAPPRSGPMVSTPETRPAPAQPASTRGATDAVKGGSLGTLKVTRPGTGDHFFQGGEMTIEWSKHGNVPDKCFRISLYKDNEEVREIAPKVCVNGYRWKIPDDLWGSSYRVRVMTTDRKVSAQSSMFPINASQADLTVGKLTATPEKLQAGEEVTIRVRIDNTGQAKSKPKKAWILAGSWWNTYGSARRTEYTIPALAFGGHTYITHKEKPPAGDWIFKVVVGDYFTPGSGDKFAPDSKSVWVRVTGDKLPDLVVCIHHPLYATGDSVTVSALIQNKGNVAMGPTKARIWIERVGAFEIDVPVIRQQDMHAIHRPVTLAGNEDASYRVDVDVDPEAHWTELAETNNSITGRIVRKLPEGGAPEPANFCSDGRRW